MVYSQLSLRINKYIYIYIIYIYQEFGVYLSVCVAVAVNTVSSHTICNFLDLIVSRCVSQPDSHRRLPPHLNLKQISG